MNNLSILNMMIPNAKANATGLATAAGQTATGSTSADGFQDVLSLVSDMQVADEQTGAQAEILAKAFKETNPANVAGQLELAAMQTKMMNVGRQDVATDASPKAALVGTSTSTGLSSEMQDVAQMAQLKLAQKGNGDLAPSQAAVEQWAAAIASGDLKSVLLENDGDAPAKDVASLNGSNLNAETTNVAAPVGGTNKVASAVGTASGMENVIGAVEPPKGKGDNQNIKAKTVGVENKTNAHEGAMPMANFLLGKSANEGKADSQAGKREGKSNELRLVGKDPIAALTAKDFVLNQTVDVRSAEQKLAAPAAVGGLKDASLLGQPGDQRVSNESLNFVADKIESLKSQGGGKLKIELNPHDLGGVEIKVGMARGRLQVQLSAERPETLQALTASRDELSAKLKTVGNSDLSFASLKESRATETSAAAGAKVFSPATSSEDLVNVRSVANKTQVADLGLKSANVGTRSLGDSQSGSSSTDKSFSQSGDGASRGKSDGFARADSGWGRGERRERAMNQWEELMQDEKKSA